jgi:cell cycle checkpoint protein
LFIIYFCFLSEIYDVSFLDLDPFPLQEKLRRNSLKMDVPEKILSQAHGKVRTVADFLHENGK